MQFRRWVLALLTGLAVGMTACQSSSGASQSEPTPAGSLIPHPHPTSPVSASTGQPSQQPTPAQGVSVPVGSHGGPVKDLVSLVDTLRGAGLAVQPTEAVNQPFFSVPGQALAVNGQNVQVFEYADAAAAQRDARKVAPDGGSVGASMVNWMAPPHFYQKGRVIVLSVGDDAAVKNGLASALGPQFAGR